MGEHKIQVCPNLLASIQEHVQAVTDRYLERFTRTFAPVSDQDIPLGTLHDVDLQRVLCTSVRLAGLAARERADAILADTDAERHEHLELQAKYSKLSILTLNMFWAEAREFGSAWSAEDVGVRQDWMMVKKKSGDGGFSLAALFGGSGGEDDDDDDS